jgi:hypothetical protein
MDTTTEKFTHCVAIFERHEDAEAAVRDLQSAGFDMKKLSIVGRDYHTEEQPVGFYHTGDRVRYWGRRGAFWGSVFGILFAPAFFWIPGIGPLLTGGLIGSFLMGTIEGAVVGAAVGGGASAFAAALAGMGIPNDSVILYESAIKADKFVLLATGTTSEAQRAYAVLVKHGGQARVHAA